MSNPSSAADLIERSKKDITRIRIHVTLTVFFHLITTVAMFVMAFFKSEVFGTDFSTTLVLCAFGGLIAVLWASVAAFEVWSVPPVRGHRSLPKWEWHNRHFDLAVGVVFLDTICLLPGCVLFVLHSLGQDAIVIMKQLPGPDFAVALLFVLVAITFGLVQILTIIHTARQLHLQQDALEAHTSRTLSFSSKVLIGAKMFCEAAFFILLLVISVETANSGPILCVVFAALTASVFLLYLSELYKGLSAEAFLTRWRQFCVVECFFTYGEFWVSFIVYLLRKRYAEDFFSSVNDMPGSQRALFAVALAVMLMSVINYVCLLFFHARCMVSLDDLGSLTRLDGVDSVANLYATGRVTRVTVALEMAEQKHD